ncbi:MAG TPA: DnaJ domain-containing protein [Polyangiales bacterium]
MADAPDPLEQLDYYSLLQVEAGASADQIRAAFHRFAAKYHPDRFLGGGADGAKIERAAQIYRRGAEAYKVLCDPPRRKQYDAGLARGQLRFDANAEPEPAPAIVGQWPIKVKNPVARPFATKAEQAYKAGDFGTAKVNLKLALAKDPGNAQVGVLLADVDARLAQAPGTK